jgi:hypothetical protein
MDAMSIGCRHENEVGKNALRRPGFSCQKFPSSRKIVMTAPHPAPDGEAVDELDKAAAEARAVCGGDSLAAIKALLLANAFLERELDLARAAVSSGYSRGWHLKRARAGNVEEKG